MDIVVLGLSFFILSGFSLVSSPPPGRLLAAPLFLQVSLLFFVFLPFISLQLSDLPSKVLIPLCVRVGCDLLLRHLSVVVSPSQAQVSNSSRISPVVGDASRSFSNSVS